MCELVELRGDILSVPVIGWPVVHAMKVYTGRKQIGIAPQTERGQIAAITAAPQSNMFCLDIVAALQIFSSSHDVLIFRRAAPRSSRRFSKRPAVADSAA